MSQALALFHSARWGTLLPALLLSGLLAMGHPTLALALALLGATLGLFLLFGRGRESETLVLVLVALTPLLGGLRRGVGIPSLRLQEVLLLLVFSWVVVDLLMERRRPRWTAVDAGYLLLLFLGTLLPLVGLLIRGEPLSLEGFFTLAGPAKFYLVYRIALEAVESERWLRRVLQGLLLSGVVVAGIGVAEHLEIAGARSFLQRYFSTLDAENTQGVWLQLESGTWRIMATAGSWNVLGAFFAFNLVLLAGFVMSGERLFSRVANALVFAATAVGLALTGSMASVLGLVLGLAVLCWTTGAWKKGLVLLAAGVVAVLPFYSFLEDRIRIQYPVGHAHWLPNSVLFRLELWREQFLPALEGHWLWGWGPEVPPAVDWMTEESYYLFTLFKGGIPYLLAALFLFALLARVLHRQSLRTQGAQRVCARAALALSFALLIMNLNNAYSTYTVPAQSFWLLVGLALAPLAQKRREG